tara:strand:+ start:42 stop:1136 length:1095 start_codon:yes stop_codon:yes gene_type:complete
MKDINLNNFLSNNLIDIPEEVSIGVVSLPTGLNFSNAIKRVKNQNKHANMKFTFSNPDYSGLVDKFDWANSALIFAYDYKRKINSSNLTSKGFGQVARFAQQDYYLPLKKIINEFENLFTNLDIKYESFIDNPRHYDRSFFESSGMGWQGKSTMMLSPGKGPWQLLGTIYVEEKFQPTEEKQYSCGTCNLCQISCPTGALDEEYKLDANKCISYWLQSPDNIPYTMRESIGNRFYGCDECLVSCPTGQNKKIKINTKNNSQVNLEHLILTKNEEILTNYYWFYIPKRNADFLKRNAVIALTNNPTSTTFDFFTKIYTQSSEIVKLYLLWSFWKLGRIHEVEHLISNEISKDLIIEYEKLKSMTS